MSSYSGLRVPSDYTMEAMDRLRSRYLNVSLSDVALPPLHLDAQEFSVTQKEAANEATPVEQEQLTAQEWFEKSFKAINRDEKIRSYTKAISLDPRFAEAYYQRGLQHHTNGDLDNAIYDYTQAISYRPDFAEAYNNRGNTYQLKGKFDNAIDDYTNSIKFKNPELILPYSNRANARKLINNFKGAIADYSEVIRLKPDAAYAYYNRGNLYQVLGDLKKAINDYEIVLELSPNDIIAKASLMNVLRKIGKVSEADKYEQIVRNLISKENEYNQACFLATLGNTKEALNLLRIAIEKKPSRIEWARRDPDFESIRDNRDFKKIVGE